MHCPAWASFPFRGNAYRQSVLSFFPRHEYFRRILCNLIGEDMEKGLIPNDFSLAADLVGDVCYHNARNFFGFYEN